MFTLDNLRLRPLLKSDLYYLNKWKNDEAIFKYLGGGYNPISIDQQADWIDKMIAINDKDKRYIIEYKEKPIGMIGLYAINNIYQNCECGLYIGESDHHSLGLASKSYKLIEKYALEYLNLRKIKIFVVEDNTGAVKFWHKNDFKTVGKLVEERYIKGEFKDLLIMEKFIK